MIALSRTPTDFPPHVRTVRSLLIMPDFTKRRTERDMAPDFRRVIGQQLVSPFIGANRSGTLLDTDDVLLRRALVVAVDHLTLLQRS
jgi:hypothetical protein